VLFWHLGGTTALARYAFRDERMDLRMLMLGAMLPNLVDTPVGLIVYASLQSVRLVTHSLLLAAVLMTVVLLSTRRGRPRKHWMPLAIGVLIHLLLDAMWSDAETLWWPFLGWDFTAAGPATAGEYVASILQDWRMWALELAGLTYLVVLGRRARVTTPAARQLFRTTGRINVPIRQT
jgi:membrane-bound metal-dependent hydrolase YbcI (DUF457 family)